MWETLRKAAGVLTGDAMCTAHTEPWRKSKKNPDKTRGLRRSKKKKILEKGKDLLTYGKSKRGLQGVQRKPNRRQGVGVAPGRKKKARKNELYNQH